MQEINELIIKKEFIDEFQTYLYEKEHAKATILKYITDIRTFYKYLGDIQIVNRSVLINYKEWLLKNYAISSVNSLIIALNQFLCFLNKAKMKLRRVKSQKQMYIEQEKILTQKDYCTLIKTAKKKGKEQLAMIIETIGTTGIRISELPYFTVEAVKTGRVEIYNKGKYRIILLPKSLRLNLLKYIKKSDISEGIVFQTKNGNAKDRSNIWREMKSLTDDCDVKKIKVFPHNLRHLFARTFYKVTKNLVNLADILGHSNMEITRIYTMNSLKDSQKHMEKVYRYYEKSKGILQQE